MPSPGGQSLCVRQGHFAVRRNWLRRDRRINRGDVTGDFDERPAEPLVFSRPTSVMDAAFAIALRN